MHTEHSAVIGAILGTAVGDAIGLPYEGLSKQRGARRFGEPDRHHFFLGGGMVSDDTEHTCLVAQALITSGGDTNQFSRHLGARLRWWLLGLPAGIGSATLKAILKLWCGFSPRHSGVYSAGNGPAMRSAILGAAVDSLSEVKSLVIASTRITHNDPKAEYGALAIALAAHLARQSTPISGDQYLAKLRSFLAGESAEEFLDLIERAVQSAASHESTPSFAESQGWVSGVSGYVYQTVPVVIQAWLQNQQDLQAGVMTVIRCGGDTDTTGAIVGGIIGAHVGKAGIPATWLRGLHEWPRSVSWMERLGQRLTDTLRDGKPGRRALRLSIVGLFCRNLLFFVIVLVHGFRRLLPPY